MKLRLGLLVQAVVTIRDSIKAPFWGSRVDKPLDLESWVQILAPSLERLFSIAVPQSPRLIIPTE